MADDYARASGRPGTCFAQNIGASNLAANLREALVCGRHAVIHAVTIPKAPWTPAKA